MSGVDATGFTPVLLPDILADVESDELALLGANTYTGPEEPLGQVNGIIANGLAELWEVAEAVYAAFDESKAEGAGLASLAALTGTQGPRAPTFGRVTCTVVLAQAQTLPAGSIANVVGQPLNRWQSAANVVNAGATAASFTVAFICLASGPVLAPAGQLSVITVPVGGWVSVTNPLDAAPGAVAESDTALRLRRRAELAQGGADTIDGIEAAMLEVPGVVQCTVFENTASATDGNGLPPFSFETVVFDGLVPAAADAAIAQIVWDNKPSGGATYGVISTTVPDRKGRPRVVQWSRAPQVSIWLEFDITTDSTFPADGVAQVKAFVVAKARATQTLGVPVVVRVYEGAVLAANGGVTGVVDCTALRLGFATHPTGTANLAVAGRAIAVADTSRILVNGA